jgi:ubiquitin C-terminal hydrolase
MRLDLSLVKSADPLQAEDLNKENWERAGEVVDIHKILQMSNRDMEADTTGTSMEDKETASVHDELPEHCQQVSSLPDIMKSLVSKMGLEQQTTTQQEMLPQDMGFPNPPGSNRCWMNATLQTLLGMEPFMEELESSCRKNGGKKQSPLLRSFFQVLKYRRRGRRLSLNCALMHLSRSLGILDAVFTNGRQQDATEFLVRLLDLFREHFSSSNPDLGLKDHKKNESCILRGLQLDNLATYTSPVHGFAGGGSHVGVRVCNPVCDNLEFCLRETYCCTDCSKNTAGYQDHLYLFLDIPPTSQARPSLQCALNYYMQSDVRELKCGRCSGQHSKVVTTFTKLPRFLLVQVKRYTVQMSITEKLTSLVRVPISLSVKNYVSDDVIMPALWLPKSSKDNGPLQLSLDDDNNKELQKAICQNLDEDQEMQELEKAIRLSLQEQQLTMDKDCSLQLGDPNVPLSEMEAEDESPDYSYRLVSVIMHQGASPNCGHYMADVYNLKKQQWYHYDDNDVSHPTEDEVVGIARQSNGYIFCYMHRRLFNQLTAMNSYRRMN